MSDDKSACAKCGHGTHKKACGYREWLHGAGWTSACGCPAPAPDKSAVLTRACGEKLTLACDLPRGHAGPHWEDERPALRAEVERISEIATQRHNEILVLRAEVERLTAEVEREHKRATEPPVVTRELARAREGRDKAEARVATLEKALREIVEHEADCLCTGNRCSGIARAALEGK